MAGRDINPGELTYNDLNDHIRFLSRPEKGVIGTPDTKNGVLRIAGTRIVSEKEVTCPVLWLSIDGRTSAWGRYMPMGNERCHILYRNDGTPIFHSYDATATQDDRAGWTELAKAQQNGVSGWSTFRQLKRGEFDFKSSGDAYIFGSNMGTLLLAGGQAYIKLDKQAYRIESKATEFHQTSGASQTRIGNVFRKTLPTDLAETQVPPGPWGASAQEFLVDLNTANPLTGTPLNPLQSKVRLHFGDILDSFGVPVISTKLPAPLRGVISLGNAASVLEAFRLEIDQLGNASWVQNPAGVLGLDMSMFKWNVVVATQAAVDCQQLALNATVGSFIRGADTPMVRGADLVSWITSALMVAFNTHTHPTGVGPSGPPIPGAQIPLPAPPATVLSQFATVK